MEMQQSTPVGVQMNERFALMLAIIKQELP